MAIAFFGCRHGSTTTSVCDLLQIGISWFYGLTSPGDTPVPVCTGSHAGNKFTFSDLSRSLIHGGQAISVKLSEEVASEAAVKWSRFGSRKCSSGDHAGRWLALQDGLQCKPPFCTGNRFMIVQNGYLVSRLLDFVFCTGLYEARLCLLRPHRKTCATGCGCHTTATTICTVKRTFTNVLQHTM